MGRKKRHKKLLFPFVLGLVLIFLAIYGFKGEFITNNRSSFIRRELLTVRNDDISMTRLDPSELLSPSVPPVLGPTHNAPPGSIGFASTRAAQIHAPSVPITKNYTRISPMNKITPPVHSTAETPAIPPKSQVALPPVVVQAPLHIPLPAGPPLNWRSPVNSSSNRTGAVPPVPSPPRNLSTHLSPSITSSNNSTSQPVNHNSFAPPPFVSSLPPLQVAPPAKDLPAPLSSPNVPIAESPKEASNDSPLTPVASPPVQTDISLSPVTNSSNKAPVPVPAPPTEISSHSIPVASPSVGKTAPLVHVNSSSNKAPVPVPTPLKEISSHLVPVNNSSNKAPVPVPAPPKEISSHLAPASHSINTTHALSPVTTSPVAAPPKEERSTHLSHHNISHKGQGPVISPAPRQAPSSPGPSVSPSPVHPPTGEGQVPSPSPVLPPTGDGQVPSPSPVHHWPSISPSPVPSPSPVHSSPFIHHKHKRPAPIPAPAPFPHETIQSLPPPPPNLYCTPLSCAEPYTNSPHGPGSPCTCVLPIKIGLRLSVSLYSFFNLVSTLASELASGVRLKQSQVRVMGANSASGGSDRTDVLVDLVPLAQRFDDVTPMWVFDRFWRKEVGISEKYFGDYEVLYVIYPGLPPSPPVSPLNPDGNNNGRTEHPLAADVRKSKPKQKGSIIAIIVLSSIFALVLCFGAIWFFILKFRGGFGGAQIPVTPTSKPSMPSTPRTALIPNPLFSLPSSSLNPYKTLNSTTKTFSLSTLSLSTHNFHPSALIGEGGFGRVYAGILQDSQQPIAVKVLKREDQQGGKEFFAEVEMLSRLHHRNLVSLIGICVEGGMRCLVYELVPNGSVESHLYGGDKDAAPLNWPSRVKIALGSARALAYLHEDSSPRVIHRDFKSSNILLETDFTPKVSDFGLARAAIGGEGGSGSGHISTRVMGTFGYVAPEYAMTGHLLVKSDVYSYGVVLLELLTGRKPVDMSRPPGQENLVTWALPLLSSQEGLKSIIDESVWGESVRLDRVAKVAAIAEMCVQPEADQRPFMGEVVQALKLFVNEGNESHDEYDYDNENNDRDESCESEGLFGATSASPRFGRDGSGSFRVGSGSGPMRVERQICRYEL